MSCVSPKPKDISPMDIVLVALRSASKNALRILHAKYSLIGKKGSGVKRVPSVPSGPPIVIMTFLLMNAFVVGLRQT